MALTKISQAGAKDEAINEAKIQISNAGTNGQYLQKQSGNTGGLTWADVSTADATKMPLAGGTFTGDVIWDNQTNAGKDLTWDESDDALEFKDGVKATFGDGVDLVIGHDFTNHVDKSLISSSTDLDISSNKVSFMDQNRVTRFTVDHNNAVLDIADNAKLRFGTGNDLELRHDGTSSFIDQVTDCPLYIRSTQANTISLQPNTGEDGVKIINDGAVELYYNGVKKIETTNSGLRVYGNLDLEDSEIIRLGDGDDFQLYHAGGVNYIDSLNSSTLRIRQATGDINANFITDGAVELYYDNAKKIETTSTGATVTGKLVATGDIDSGTGYYQINSGTTRFSLTHDGANCYLENQIGSFYVKTVDNVNTFEVGNDYVALPNDSDKLKLGTS